MEHANSELRMAPMPKPIINCPIVYQKVIDRLYPVFVFLWGLVLRKELIFSCFV